MLLSELTTPLQRHRVIEYASVGNNTVRRWREMRNVAGPIYMSDPIADEYGDLRFNLYLVFPDIPDGAVYQHDMVKPDLYKREALMERFVREDGSRHTDGSGLGLSIAQSLMRLQGGKLWLHTEGDVFTAQLLFRK